MPTIHPELAAVARWLPRAIVFPWTYKILRWLPGPSASLPAGIRVMERPVPGGHRVRIVAGPARRDLRPAVLWIHGGGYVVGTAKDDDGRCGRLAEALGAVVVSVEYRLAPDVPYPGPLDDCVAAYTFLHREAASLGIDTARVAIAGASAGGGLAAALALRIHDAGLPAPVLQLLVYPMLDDRTVLRDLESPNYRLWNPTSNRFGWTSYLGRQPGSADVPEHAAPSRRVDLRGLPPAWVGVGTCDLFHDEDLAYAARLREAGVPTDLNVVEGAFHGFDLLAPSAPVSEAFVASWVVALRQAFSAG